VQDYKRSEQDLLRVLQEIFEKYPNIKQSEFDLLEFEGKPSRGRIIKRFKKSWNEIVKMVLGSSVDNLATVEEEQEPISASREYLTKQNQVLKRELDKAHNYNQVFIENCLAEIEKINIKPAKIPSRENSPDNLEFHALRSDAHVGEYTDPITVQGLAEYNSDIYAERVSRWTEKVIIFKQQDKKSLGLNKFVCNYLGDMVTGESIYPGQAFHLDLNLTDQLFRAVEIESNALLQLAQVFPEIEIMAVVGNHGRVGKKGDHSEFSVDYIFYRTLQMVLSKQENIKMFVSESPSMLVKHGEYTFLLNHGSNAKSWNGIPYYGIERMFRRMHDLYGIRVNVELMGHVHQSANLSDRVIVNGSLPGGSDLSINRMGLSNTPSQKIFYFDKYKGVNRESNLYLADSVNLTEDAQGIYTAYV
jgi:hypothetical protein